MNFSDDKIYKNTDKSAMSLRYKSDFCLVLSRFCELFLATF